MAGVGEPRIRVLLLEDHEMVATAFARVIRSQPDLELVDSVASAADGLAVAREHPVDMIVTDLNLSDGSVLPHMPDLRSAAGGARVLVVTGAPSVTAAADALGAGAAGFLAKSDSMIALLDGIRRVAHGEVVLSPAYLPALLGRLDPDHHDNLSRREIDVLELFAAGKRTAQVAGELHLSPNTVRNHLARIFVKLDAHSRLEAVAEAQRRGLINGPGTGSLH